MPKNLWTLEGHKMCQLSRVHVILKHFWPSFDFLDFMSRCSAPTMDAWWLFSQVFYDQYHTWDIFLLGVKSISFSKGQTISKANYGLFNSGSLAENTEPQKYPQFFFGRSDRIGPNVRVIVEKSLHWASIVRGNAFSWISCSTKS